MTESSANLKTCLPSYCERHSFVYKTKRRGERTHPWGEPVEDKRLPDKTPLTLTLWDLEDKKSTSQAISPGLILCVFESLSAKMWGWIQLKADEKSINSSALPLPDG